MPIVNPTSTALPVEAPIPQVQVAAPEFKGVAVDAQYQPASSLLTHVEGASWTVNYYQQVLGADSQLSGQQVNLQAAYQQYRRIRGLELKVTTELTMSQNTEGGFMNVSGAATVYPFLIPNVGDMFVADVADGKEGLFKITNSEKKTIYRETCYTVEFILVKFLDAQTAGDLASKVVEKLVFVRDFLEHGQNPLLEDAQFAATALLVERYHQMFPRWLKEFTSTERMTLLVPGQERELYDPFLVKAVMTLFSTRDDWQLSKVRILNVDDDFAMKAYSVWDALIEQDRGLLQAGFKKAASVSTATFTKNPMLEGIRYSGIRSVIYPQDPDATVNLPAGFTAKPYELDYLAPASASDVLLADTVAPDVLDVSSLNPIAIHPVSTQDWYVFSSAFYGRADGQSLLETQTLAYIDKKALDGTALLALCYSTPGWGLLERFYYTPILLTLIRAYVREL